jgi:hypothetical protein
MKHAVEIKKPARSAYEAAENENLRGFLDDLVEKVSAGANWRVRKKTLLDLIGAIEAATIALHRASVEPETPRSTATPIPSAPSSRRSPCIWPRSWSAWTRRTSPASSRPRST